MSFLGRIKQVFARSKEDSADRAAGEGELPARAAPVNAPTGLRTFESTAAGVAWLTATHNRARAAMAKNQNKLAIHDLDQLIAQFPIYDVAYFDRGACYHSDADARPAIADLSRAIALLPDGEMKAFAHLNRAAARDQLGDIRAAVEDAEAACRLLPAVAVVAEERAKYRRKLDGLGGAVAALPPVAARAAARAAEGRSLHKRGALVDALVAFDDWVALAPDDPDSHCARGMVNLMLRRPVQARADLDRALELDPLHVSALAERGILHAEAGDFDQAMTDYDRAIQLNPAYAPVQFNKGSAFALQARYAEAIPYIDLAIQLEPGTAEFYFNRARCHAALGRRQRAREDFSKALALRPDATWAHAAREALLELERDAQN